MYQTNQFLSFYLTGYFSLTRYFFSSLIRFKDLRLLKKILFQWRIPKKKGKIQQKKKKENITNTKNHTVYLFTFNHLRGFLDSSQSP